MDGGLALLYVGGPPLRKRSVTSSITMEISMYGGAVGVAAAVHSPATSHSFVSWYNLSLMEMRCIRDSAVYPISVSCLRSCGRRFVRFRSCPRNREAGGCTVMCASAERWCV